MIRNSIGLVFLLLAGCSKGSAADAHAFQGVVEHEDRVLGLELGGRVIALPVNRGDRVTPGQTLVRLDDGLERPVRDVRAAEVRAASAQLRLLEAGVARGGDPRHARRARRGP